MTKKCAAGAGTMQNSAEGRCTIPAPSRPPPPGDSIDWCIMKVANRGVSYMDPLQAVVCVIPLYRYTTASFGAINHKYSK